ncbi:hypothetical protein GCM10010521_50960 [Streptomyces rameus]|uniref:MFS transporter n=1 Tax=Streptomyces rameus TaxID=68261 RepID=A0ABP6NS19_9ACTN
MVAGCALVAAGIGHPWGFCFFAAVAALAFVAVLTLPATRETAAEPAV